MDGWMDGWMDRWTDSWGDLSLEGSTSPWNDGVSMRTLAVFGLSQTLIACCKQWMIKGGPPTERSQLSLGPGLFLKLALAILGLSSDFAS